MNTIIFDLDGTLIDSASSILGSLEYAFSQSSISLEHSLSELIIGPPLDQIILSLAPKITKTERETVKKYFKAHYDSVGYREAFPFEGVNDLLLELQSQGKLLHIVTNKRSLPTSLILERLCWSEVFRCVYSIDSFQNRKYTKNQLIAKLLLTYNVSSTDACYVGDRIEDAQAASENSLLFVKALGGAFLDSESQPFIF